MQTITLKGYGTNIPPYEAIELGTYDSYGVEQLQIVPSHGWENLSIIASFFPPSGAEPIKVAVLSGGIIDVPPGATAKQSGKGIIVFAGYKANTQLISTNVAYNIRDHKDIASGDPVCPTPSVVDQIVNAAKSAQENAEKAAGSAKKAEDVADSVRNDADEGKFNGEDGYSPSANVTQIENGAVISIRDKTGESTATIYNGKDGAKGDKGDTGDKGNTGAKGDKGDKGFSPTAAVTQLENGAEITITDEKGTTKATVKNGIKGDKGDRGSNGVSPTISVEDIENGHRVTIVDATGTTSVDIYNGEDGTDGKDGVQIDDAAVSEDAPWSSKHIIDMLCPPLEESGNPVVCYPVAGYPLGVKASWEPMQEGTGTPSPENIRPIKGRDSVKVERCGENLLPFGERIENIYNQRIMTSDDLLLLSKACAGQEVTLTFSVETQNIVFNDDVEDELRKRVGFECHGTLADGEETWTLQCWLFDSTDELTKNGIKTKTLTVTMPKLASGSIIFYAQNIKSGSFVAYDFGIYAGTTVPTTYTPYIGQTNTLTLPETVYGGEVDAVSGDGQDTQKLVILNGTESWYSWGINAHNPAITGFYTYDINDYDAKNTKGICSHLETPNQDVWGGRNAGIDFATVGSSRYFMLSMLTSSLPDISAGHEVASLKAYLAAQNDAGTPVQIAYKLATPTPFTATGAQPIPALAGANTVLTDADSVTVTGRADPIKRIEDLEAAVASIN